MFDTGIINIHPGLLPENRGLDNIKWALYHNMPQGLTVNFIRKRLFEVSPKSLSIVTLLLKPDVAKLDFKVDIIGFEIPPDFVVGYGLDFNQKLRHLDSIYHIDRI